VNEYFPHGRPEIGTVRDDSEREDSISKVHSRFWFFSRCSSGVRVTFAYENGDLTVFRLEFTVDRRRKRANYCTNAVSETGGRKSKKSPKE